MAGDQTLLPGSILARIDGPEVVSGNAELVGPGHVRVTVLTPDKGFAHHWQIEITAEAPGICDMAVALDQVNLARVVMRDEICIRVALPETAATMSELVFDIRFSGVATADLSRCKVAGFHLAKVTPEMGQTPRLNVSLDELHAENPAIVSDRDLMLRFASMGDNCEFGIVQRKLDVDPLDLLRFAAVPLRWILFGLDDGYARMDDPNLCELTVDAVSGPVPHWYAYQSFYRIPFATGIAEHQQTHANIHRDIFRRFQFLGKKFIRELGTGKRIFLFRRDFPIADEELAAVLVRFRRYGSAWLVAVQEADAEHPSGTIERVLPGVLRVFVPAFADARCVVETVDVPLWTRLCRDIYRIIWDHEIEQRAEAALPPDFDHATYLTLHPDVAAARFDAAEHYLKYGMKEGRAYR